MSWRRPFDRFPKATKKPPPAHGIKLSRAGTTWWGERWIEALQTVLSGDAARLARGRTYARAGRVHDLVVAAGVVSAAVTGTRATPYAVRIELRQLTDAAWQSAIAYMANKARFSAELLAGRMPQDIDEAFRDAAKGSLFPHTRLELRTRCSCPDSGDPCKHVAATHYVLGEAIDRDPFLLFELRGRAKADVLDALRSARGGSERNAPSAAAVTLGTMRPADYDKARGALPALSFSFEAPHTHAAAMRQLGKPASWSHEHTPSEVLSPVVEAAARAARRIALAEEEGATRRGANAPPVSERLTPGDGGRASQRRGRSPRRR